MFNSFEVFLGYPINNDLKNYNKQEIHIIFEYKYINQTYIGESKYIKKLNNNRVMISDKVISKSLFLKENDVLIKVTPPHQAIIIDSIDEEVLVPSSYIVIRNIENKSIMNKIEVWTLINSTFFKKWIGKVSKITNERYSLLSISDIKNIKNSKIDIENIKSISEINYKSQKLIYCYKILSDLIDTRNKYYEMRVK